MTASTPFVRALAVIFLKLDSALLFRASHGAHGCTSNSVQTPLRRKMGDVRTQGLSATRALLAINREFSRKIDFPFRNPDTCPDMDIPDARSDAGDAHDDTRDVLIAPCRVSTMEFSRVYSSKWCCCRQCCLVFCPAILRVAQHRSQSVEHSECPATTRTLSTRLDSLRWSQRR